MKHCSYVPMIIGFINPISKSSVFKIQLVTPKWKQNFQCTLSNNLDMGFINPTHYLFRTLEYKLLSKANGVKRC